MSKLEENQLVESILAEFEKTNSHMGELMRLQSELSHAENELIALQIRYVHKNKENEDLKLQLEKKNKLLNEKTTDTECKFERYQSLEFHYNDLLQKHKLCLECMAKQKSDIDILNENYDSLLIENKRIENDKHQLKELFTDQVNDLEIHIRKLVEESEQNMETNKELKRNWQSIQMELDKSKELNNELIETNQNLIKSLEALKDQYNRSVGDQCFKNDSNEEKINELELELARTNSKLDESYLQFNEMKTNYLNQIKITESLQITAHNKDIQYDELKASYEKCLYEIQTLNQINLNQKQEFELQLNDFQNQIDNNCKVIDNENGCLKKQKKTYEILMRKIVISYNEKQKMIENLISVFKNQNLEIKDLKDKIVKFRQNFKKYKSKYHGLLAECAESNIQIKNMQEKCFDLETKYSEKCEHLNTLERENYLTRNSLESAMNDLTNLSNVITNKNEEIQIKNQTIDRMESIINQLNIELGKRKAEINERIAQIEILDKHIKEEKTVLDLKMAHLEANLKSKSKQLNQRIEQIKEMSDLVNNLKDEKEQAEYKLEQLDNLVKCQKLEIESKSSLVKQLELRIKDTKNEVEHLRNELNTKSKQIEDFSTPKHDSLSEILKSFEIKEIQTDEILKFAKEVETDKAQFSETGSMSSYEEDRLKIEELQMSLKVKENVIETINDTLVLKEAEIARLKTRIAMKDREKIINELNIEKELA